jgi:hypothetical protein
VYFFDFVSGATRLVTSIGAYPNMGLAVSPDRRHILYTQNDHVGRDLILVNGFR